MTQNANERHEGHKLQLWVSDEIFAVLQRQAHRHNVSLAEAARQLMQSGIAPSATMDAIVEGFIELDRFIRLHLEPLAFVAAMDAAKVAAYEKQRIAAQRQLYLASNPRSDGKDDSDRQADFIDRQMAERATKRIQRVLREIESPAIDLEDLEEEEDADHADE